MDDRFNTIAGWVLFAGIVALGSSIVAGELFHSERPEKMGYPIAGVQEESAGGAAAEQPIEVYLAKADPAKGQQIFNKCMACHNADKGGANQMGPNLWGILGSGIAEGRGALPFLLNSGDRIAHDLGPLRMQELAGNDRRSKRHDAREQYPAGNGVEAIFHGVSLLISG